jgi:glyoxylase-like metal-dependent hydrolase (beta-lactamase superfamily II)
MPSPHDPDTVIRLTLGTNNVYAVPDPNGVTLIDAGPDYEGAWEELVEQLRTNGIMPADIHTVLLTHAHLDHAGLAARFQATGARILIGRADAPALEMNVATRGHERTLARDEMLRHGVPPGTLTHQPWRGERYTRWPAPLRITAVNPDGFLEGERCTGHQSRPLTVIMCPGHTPGTALFLDSVTGTLFTGDHVLPRMAPPSGIQFEGTRRRPSLPAYLASLHAARFLADRVTAVLPGHGEPIDDLAEAVDWTVRLLEQRARRVTAQLRHRPSTAYEIATRLFAHLRPQQLRPVMAECIGLLDLLAERGQAVADESDDAVVWRAITLDDPTGYAVC